MVWLISIHPVTQGTERGIGYAVYTDGSEARASAAHKALNGLRQGACHALEKEQESEEEKGECNLLLRLKYRKLHKERRQQRTHVALL